MKHGFLLVCCILAFTAGDFFAARWAHTRAVRPLLLALLVGPFAYLLFGHLSATTSLARMGGYVNSGVVLTTTIAGVVLLGERPDLRAWVGILLIVCGLTVLTMGRVDTIV